MIDENPVFFSFLYSNSIIRKEYKTHDEELQGPRPRIHKCGAHEIFMRCTDGLTAQVILRYAMVSR